MRERDWRAGASVARRELPGINYRLREMHLSISLLFATTVFLLVAPFGIAAQEESPQVNTQLWIDYNPRWTDQSSREIFGDLGLRTVLGSNDWARLVARPGVRAPVGPFRLAGGLGTFYRINKEGADRMEIRPFQGIAATWPRRTRLRIQHYLRLEERFIWETADWTKDSSLRGRYRLQTDYSFSGFSSGVGWRVVFHIEGFSTLAGNGGQTEEQIRIGAGIGRNLGSKLRLRADFTWEKVGFDAFGPTNQFFVRLRVYQGWLRRLTTQDG